MNLNKYCLFIILWNARESLLCRGGRWEASGTNMIRTALLSVVERPEHWIISSVFSPYKWLQYVYKLTTTPLIMMLNLAQQKA